MGVLRVTVASAVFPKRIKAACLLRVARQSVTTKVRKGRARWKEERLWWREIKEKYAFF